MYLHAYDFLIRFVIKKIGQIDAKTYKFIYLNIIEKYNE